MTGGSPLVHAVLPAGIDDPSRPSGGTGSDRSPGELFHEFLGARSVDDRRVEELFARLHDRVSTIEEGI